MGPARSEARSLGSGAARSEELLLLLLLLRRRLPGLLAARGLVLALDVLAERLAVAVEARAERAKVQRGRVRLVRVLEHDRLGLEGLGAARALEGALLVVVRALVLAQLLAGHEGHLAARHGALEALALDVRALVRAQVGRVGKPHLALGAPQRLLPRVRPDVHDNLLPLAKVLVAFAADELLLGLLARVLVHVDARNDLVHRQVVQVEPRVVAALVLLRWRWPW
mmetsp:Transcript_9036/g.28800  ORF Transcript_9036/g.28800 Transcript_9036/m.28800 type:complete len:225 (+) Transcript_9036:101-775(+)